MSKRFLAAWVLMGQACATQYLPAREPPPDAPPSIAVPDNVPPNMGRLVIETERPTEVIEVEGRSTFSNYRRTLCVTPCFVDLALGPHELRFSEQGAPEKTSVFAVNVTAGTTLLRYNVGSYADKSSRRLIGGTLLGLGATALGVGSGVLVCDFRCVTDSGMTLAATGAVIGGLAAAVGAYLLVGSGDVDQPGQGTLRPVQNKETVSTPLVDPQATPAPQALNARTAPTRRFDLDILESDGVRVIRVGPSFGLLAKGDVVLRVGNKPIATAADLQAALEASAPGSVVPVTLRRGGAEQTVTIVVPAGTP
jgi:hypothetical protein